MRYPRLSFDLRAENAYYGDTLPQPRFTEIFPKEVRSYPENFGKGGSFNFMIHMQDVMAKPMPDFREGSIVKGRILEIRPREVWVDVGYKSEGVIPLEEFGDVDSLDVGDAAGVRLARLEDQEGMVVP